MHSICVCSHAGGFEQQAVIVSRFCRTAEMKEWGWL